MKILYFGSLERLSSKPLKALLNNEFNVCALAIDATANHIQQLAIIDASANTAVSLAWAHQIPIIRIDSNFNNSLQELESYQPDIIIIACYARRLPESVTSLAKLGCFNIHPSLLPAYRGPDPVFWQLRAGEQTMGVTIHKVTQLIDGGDILIQQPQTLANGLTLSEINETLATVAANLLLKLLAEFEHYQSRAYNQANLLLPAPAYYSFAQATDYNLSDNGSAQCLYNFICAYARSNRYFNCSINGETFHLSQALWFDLTATQSMPYLINEDKITFICSSGLIQCRLSHNHL